MRKEALIGTSFVLCSLGWLIATPARLGAG